MFKSIALENAICRAIKAGAITDPEMLDDFSTLPSKSVQLAVFACKYTAFETIRGMIRRDHYEPNIEEAIEKGLSEKIVGKLCIDEDKIVRAMLAKNETLPEKFLDMLAHDAVAGIRTLVSLNNNTSPETLERMLDDSEGWVRQNADFRLRSFVYSEGGERIK